MRFVVVLLCLPISGLFYAQDVPRIRNFLPSAYHGQNQNWSLAQSASGWIYAGNNGGMLEFDGAEWRSFALPEGQTIRTVVGGPGGKIFCGGFAEFGYWQPDSTGRLAYHSLSSQLRAEHLGKEEIWHILVQERFVLFQSFSTIYKYDFQKVTILKPPNSIMFARAVNGRILVPVIGRGLYELLPENTFRFVPGTEPLADRIVQFLVPNGAGGIWAGTTNHGIFEIKSGQCQPWNHPLNKAFKQYQLNKAIGLRQGGWAIGTILNGVYILEKTGNLRFRLNRENGLQNNTVLALCEDRDGNLWLGLDHGIDLVTLNAPFTFFTDQSGKIGTVYTAARWRGNLYIGTNQGVFVRNGSGFQLVAGSQGQVWQLAEFGGQLMCGHNAGTFLIDGMVARSVSDVTGGWCTVAAPGHPDVLIQGTYTGLVVFRRTPGGAWRLHHRVEGFTEPLKKIMFDARDNLWGAHPNKGLFRLRLNNDLSQVLEYQVFSRESGLPTDFKPDLSLINNKPVVNTPQYPLYISDSAGTIRFQPARTAARRQKWMPGHGSDFFAVDTSGTYLHTQGKTYLLPLFLVPGYENIVLLDRDEYLFCLESGFALLDKRRLEPYQPQTPAPAIRFIDAGGGQALLPKGEMHIPYRQNTLKFTFTVPYFERAPAFAWRLEGFADAWSPWQNNPEKEFTNLAPGKYVFHLRSDTGGPETALPFRILAPWYLSAWAIAIYLFLLIVCFAVLENISRTRLRRQRQRLEMDQRQELSRQRSDAEREKLALEVDNKSRELSNAALNLIRKNEVLQRLRDELLHSGNDPRALQKLARLIDQNLEGDHDWNVFEESFNRVHDDFFKRLMLEFPEMTPGDLRLAAYLKMNLSSKEIAPLLNISIRGVENKRYRLRKKLGLPEDANLTEYMIGY